jgi:hypothetical protein
MIYRFAWYDSAYYCMLHSKPAYRGSLWSLAGCKTLFRSLVLQLEIMFIVQYERGLLYFRFGGRCQRGQQGNQAVRLRVP